MFKKYNTKSYEIIVFLIAVLILPANGNTQTKNSKVNSNRQNIKSPLSKQKQAIKTKKPPRQLSKPVEFSTRIKELEKKLLENKTALKQANKAVAKKEEAIGRLNEDINILLDSLDDLDGKLVFQEDISKKYKEIVHCYRSALFTWYDMNKRKELTQQDYLVINVELRRSLFSCPPM